MNLCHTSCFFCGSQGAFRTRLFRACACHNKSKYELFTIRCFRSPGVIWGGVESPLLSLGTPRRFAIKLLSAALRIPSNTQVYHILLR